MPTFLVLNGFLIYLITTPDIFLKQTHFVRLGIFHLELGKKHIFLALGMGPNFGPKFRRSRALFLKVSSAEKEFAPLGTNSFLYGYVILRILRTECKLGRSR